MTNNFFLTYDLNGSTPTHSRIDNFIRGQFPGAMRVLESVWLIQSPGTSESIRQRIDSILSFNDRILVVRANDAAWRNMLLNDNVVVGAWNRSA